MSILYTLLHLLILIPIVHKIQLFVFDTFDNWF